MGGVSSSPLIQHPNRIAGKRREELGVNLLRGKEQTGTRGRSARQASRREIPVPPESVPVFTRTRCSQACPGGGKQGAQGAVKWGERRREPWLWVSVPYLLGDLGQAPTGPEALRS